MRYVRATILGVAVLLLSSLAVTVLPPVHWVGFALVPPDGSVSEVVRRREDLVISQYFIRGNSADLKSFSPTEQAHLADVRALLGWVLAAGLVSAVAAVFLAPRRSDLEPALIGLLGLGLGTLMVFPVAFERFHQLFFAAGAPWYLPADQFLLTQLYPFQFFAAMWLVIVLMAALLLLTVRRFLTSEQ
ncbi:DUF1461 domain-containing protein [Candidatus Berkelbacteria bacterium]|nr:DUF1461 domain-containing protein [Candidatus Berkelbacteria bacterium]